MNVITQSRAHLTHFDCSIRNGLAVEGHAFNLAYRAPMFMFHATLMLNQHRRSKIIPVPFIFIWVHWPELLFHDTNTYILHIHRTGTWVVNASIDYVYLPRLGLPRWSKLLPTWFTLFFFNYRRSSGVRIIVLLRLRRGLASPGYINWNKGVSNHTLFFLMS